MKTNIIHILILAIAVILGWSLFTVLQDFYNADSLRYDDYSTIGRGKQYLPLTPESYSRQQKYPVYKMPSHVQTQIAKSQSTQHQPSYSIIENDYAINSYNTTKGEGASTANRSPSTLLNANKRSGNRDMHPDSDLTKTTYNSGIGGSLTDGKRVVQALRSATDSRDAVQRRQLSSKKAYNDLPVGDGLYLLMFMAALYALYKRYIK